MPPLLQNAAAHLHLAPRTNLLGTSYTLIKGFHDNDCKFRDSSSCAALDEGASYFCCSSRSERLRGTDSRLLRRPTRISHRRQRKIGDVQRPMLTGTSLRKRPCMIALHRMFVPACRDFTVVSVAAGFTSSLRYCKSQRSISAVACDESSRNQQQSPMCKQRCAK